MHYFPITVRDEKEKVQTGGFSKDPSTDPTLDIHIIINFRSRGGSNYHQTRTLVLPQGIFQPNAMSCNALGRTRHRIRHQWSLQINWVHQSMKYLSTNLTNLFLLFVFSIKFFKTYLLITMVMRIHLTFFTLACFIQLISTLACPTHHICLYSLLPRFISTPQKPHLGHSWSAISN